jgi:thioredoxin reductase/NAD-dependent dihydropyrimidine dehydrogenase PreA subunit
MSDYLSYLAYVLPLAGIWAWYLARRRRTHAQSEAVRTDAIDAGLTEPVSLHPVIDANRCLGCGACVTACPEQPEHQVLGLIGGKAQLLSPTDCIGHGACKIACPTDAITLVFGTEKRGVTIPLLSSDFETTVPGIYVAGELGGMGLIKNALTQGREAVEAIHKKRGKGSAPLDLVIVGAGPAGFAAAITATALKMRYVVLEQDSLGGCVFQYPRGKLVMTSPAELPLVGRIRIKSTSKEDLLKFWQETESRYRLNMKYNEHVKGIERTQADSFIVTSDNQRYEARNVLLSIGRRGTPRKLGVPGEDLPKVVYRLIDAEQYRGQKVLVVGGGDSALEAAATLAETESVAVALSYRGEAFGRAKQKNRQRVAEATKNGRLKVLLNSNVREIKPDEVVLEREGKLGRLPNDTVIVNAGGVLPNDFLKSVGIAVETKFGTA